MAAVSYVLIAAAGYLLGGIPTAFLVGRLRGVDIRRVGSGNVGATNALRTLGWKAGVTVMALDVAKGYLAAGLLPLLPVWEGEVVYLGMAAGVAAILGHVFTPYLRFRGGKGVAAAAGVLVALAPLPTAIAAGAFALVAFGTGIVSLASLTAAVTLPVAAFLLDRTAAYAVHPAVRAVTVGLVPFIFYTHRQNIRRLIAGKENRFRRPGEKRSGRG
jgi:glycerol-3-phosphate acyltransferase PlsY